MAANFAYKVSGKLAGSTTGGTTSGGTTNGGSTGGVVLVDGSTVTQTVGTSQVQTLQSFGGNQRNYAFVGPSWLTGAQGKVTYGSTTLTGPAHIAVTFTQDSTTNQVDLNGSGQDTFTGLTLVPEATLTAVGVQTARGTLSNGTSFVGTVSELSQSSTFTQSTTVTNPLSGVTAQLDETYDTQGNVTKLTLVLQPSNLAVTAAISNGAWQAQVVTAGTTSPVLATASASVIVNPLVQYVSGQATILAALRLRVMAATSSTTYLASPLTLSLNGGAALTVSAAELNNGLDTGSTVLTTGQGESFAFDALGFGAASLTFLRFTHGALGAASWLILSLCVWLGIAFATAAIRLRRADF